MEDEEMLETTNETENVETETTEEIQEEVDTETTDTEEQDSNVEEKVLNLTQKELFRLIKVTAYKEGMAVMKSKYQITQANSIK